MAINLNDNIKLNAGKPLDSKYLNGVVDYISTSEVNTLIPISERYLGLTVRILGTEYWYQSGVTDLDLAKKTAGAILSIFVSKQTGNWSDLNTWYQVDSTGSLVNATRYPSLQTDIAFLEESMTITLDVDDVHVAYLYIKYTDDQVRFNLNDKIIYVDGELRHYSGDYTDPQPPVGGGDPTPLFTVYDSGTNDLGKVKLTNTLGPSPLRDEFTNATRRTGELNLEFAMVQNSDPMAFTFRASKYFFRENITVDPSSRWYADPLGDNTDTTTNVGDYLITNNAIVDGLYILARNPGVASSTYLLEAGCEHIFRHPFPTINAATVDLSGTIEMNATGIVGEQKIVNKDNDGLIYNGAVNLDSFNTLRLIGDKSVNAGQSQTMQTNFTIQEELQLSDTLFDLNSNLLLYGPRACVRYIGDTTVGDEISNSEDLTTPLDLIADGAVVTLSKDITVRGRIREINGGIIRPNGFKITQLGSARLRYGVADSPSSIISIGTGPSDITLAPFAFFLSDLEEVLPLGIVDFDLSTYLTGEDGMQIGIAPTGCFATANARIDIVTNVQSTGYDLVFKKFNLTDNSEAIKFTDDERECLIELGPVRNLDKGGLNDGEILPGSLIPAYWKAPNGSYELTRTFLEIIKSGFSLNRNTTNNNQLDVTGGEVITRVLNKILKSDETAIGAFEVYQDGLGGHTFVPFANYTFPVTYDDGTGTPPTLDNNNFTRHTLLYEPGANNWFVIMGKENIDSTELGETNPVADYGPFVGANESGLLAVAIIVMGESNSSSIFEIIPLQGATLSSSGSGSGTFVSVLEGFSAGITGALNGNSNYLITVTVTGAVIGDKVSTGVNDDFYDDIVSTENDMHMVAKVTAVDTVQVMFRIEAFMAENTSRRVWARIIK